MIATMDPEGRADGASEESPPYRILLYYQYVDIEDVNGKCQEQLELCERLGLQGRIRIASEGINGTLGGNEGSIREYMHAMDADLSVTRLNPIHWKLSNLLSHLDRDSQKFKSLSVKSTKEVVSLDLQDEEKHILIQAGGANHLSPEEFHEAITSALTEEDEPVKKTVLVDVRNIYETRIGRFDFSDQPSPNIEVLDPKSRQFSDFRRYIDEKYETIRDKKVLMYCTGGVRCERASAYLRSKGIEDVHQLFGGIHNYMESFPEGGYFKGKNFVFDPRIAVPYANIVGDQVVGTCLLCDKLYDDYRSQLRCSSCRMLVLVCDDCVSGRGAGDTGLLCENCAEHNL